MRAGAREAGRDPGAVQIVVRRRLDGPRDEVLDDLEDLRALGVTEAFLDLNLSGGDVTPEQAERVLEAFRP